MLTAEGKKFYNELTRDEIRKLIRVMGRSGVGHAKGKKKRMPSVDYDRIRRNEIVGR